MSDSTEKSKAFYDAIAESYDQQMATLATSSWARDAFRQLVLDTVSSGTLLDFGCGTGTDAVWFAERGFLVLAYDPSSEMIERTKAKGARLIERGLLTTHVSSHEEFLRFQPERPFDAVISNFGVLSHLEDLGPLLDAFSHQLVNEGYVVASVLNPWFWKDMIREWWWRSVWGSRRTGVVRVSVGEIETYRHFPSKIVNAASPWFKPTLRAGVDALIRRSASGHDWAHPRTFAEKLDKACWKRFPFWTISQHLFLVFRQCTRG